MLVIPGKGPLEPVFEDPLSRQLLADAERLAPLDNSVLIYGPTGSGKDIVARLIHQMSGRNGKFVAVNCGAIPRNLLESELFGTVKGSYSGAENRPGLLAEADHGTLLLDEIATLPEAQQVKLLSFLESRTYRAVGSTVERTTTARFLAATNVDLADMVSQGRFREDLYARLSMLPLTVPHLRDRPMDVSVLARRLAGEYRPDDPVFADRVVAGAERLSAHSNAWPLGFRNLQAYVVRAHVFDMDCVEADMLHSWGQPRSPAPAPATQMVAAPRPRDDAARRLAFLIRSRFHGLSGRPRKLASEEASLMVAEMLLDPSRANYPSLQKALDWDKRTLTSNLAPFIESGIVEIDGHHVHLVWPPVFVRMLLGQEGGWTAVPSGYIPVAHSGDRACIEVRAQTPINVRVAVISHRPDGTEQVELGRARSVNALQRRKLDLTLDDQPAFEQILVHLSWPPERGARSAKESTASDFKMPSPQRLRAQRMRLCEQVGPGWLVEYLIEHV